MQVSVIDQRRPPIKMMAVPFSEIAFGTLFNCAGDETTVYLKLLSTHKANSHPAVVIDGGDFPLEPKCPQGWMSCIPRPDLHLDLVLRNA